METLQAQSQNDARPATNKVGGGRFVLGIAFALLSAAMLYLTYDINGGLWWLTVVAFVPMYVAQYRLLPRKWSFLALGIAAYGFWLGFWINTVALIGLPAVIVVAAIPAVVFGIFGVFERRFSERTRYAWFVVQLPLLWTAVDCLLQNEPLGGAEFFMANRFAHAPQLAQPVSWFSTPALTFVILLLNAAIALLILKWMDSRWPEFTAVQIPHNYFKWQSIIAWLVVVLWVVLSFVIWSQVNSQLGAKVTVASVQPGGEFAPGGGASLGATTGTPAEEAARDLKLREELTQMTKEAAGKGAKLVVWPEIILDYDAYGPKAAWVGELAKETGAEIVTGYQIDWGNLEAPNMAAVFRPDTGVVDPTSYQKVHPVVMEGEAFTTTPRYPTYLTGFGILGVEICFDHDFPDDGTRKLVAAGATIVAVPALDPPSVAEIRWQSVVMRSIENRVPLVKTDVAWDAVIVNANGEVPVRSADTSDEGHKQLLIADVNIGPANAPFTQTGGYPFFTVVMGFLIARYVVQIVFWRKQRRVGEASATP